MLRESMTTAMASVASLLLSASVTHGQRASDAQIYATVMDAHGADQLRLFAFDERTLCVPTRVPRRCVPHTRPTVDAVRAWLQGGAPRRHLFFMLSPVRDSSSLHVVELATRADSVSPMFGSMSIYRYVVDADGRRVIEKRYLMGETTARMP